MKRLPSEDTAGVAPAAATATGLRTVWSETRLLALRT